MPGRRMRVGALSSTGLGEGVTELPASIAVLLYSALTVSSPQMPSDVSPLRVWKRRIALSVALPYTPSALPVR